MSTDSEFFELIASEVAGELDSDQKLRLDRLCATSGSLRSFRMRFKSLMTNASTDDSKDAPGQTLHRAYRIMQQELAASKNAPKVSLLSLVFDSLRPVAGLRSAGTARRQLMLESDSISVDFFLEFVPAGCAVSVMVDGIDEAEVVLVGEDKEVVLQRDDDGWYATVKPMRAKLEVRMPGRTLSSEQIDIA
ncbi:MAG: hypothetical protein ED559_08675 [Phycisphaera sp.]|nr:MAG: hypothetical protein ED559_08675 [Phycisphaera sp.]